MSEHSTIRSHDGQFELRVDEFWERSTPTVTTHVIECASGKTIFSCDGAPKAEFTGEGFLTVQYFGYEPGGIVIDPANRQFRTHSSEPWVPLVAWPLVESAYRRGWSASFRFQNEESTQAGSMFEGLLFFGAVIIEILLLWFGQAFSREPRIILSIVAAVAVFFFA